MRLHPVMNEPKDTDVSCGRGKSHWTSPGNLRYKRFITENTQRYMNASSKGRKTGVVQSVVALIEDSGRSRFVKQDHKTGKWSQLSAARVRLKVAHAIRDHVNSMVASKRKIGLKNMSKKKLRSDSGPPRIDDHRLHTNVIGTEEDHDLCQIVVNEELIQQNEQLQQFYGGSVRCFASLLHTNLLPQEQGEYYDAPTYVSPYAQLPALFNDNCCGDEETETTNSNHAPPLHTNQEEFDHQIPLPPDLFVLKDAANEDWEDQPPLPLPTTSSDAQHQQMVLSGPLTDSFRVGSTSPPPAAFHSNQRIPLLPPPSDLFVLMDAVSDEREDEHFLSLPTGSTIDEYYMRQEQQRDQHLDSACSIIEAINQKTCDFGDLREWEQQQQQQQTTTRTTEAADGTARQLCFEPNVVFPPDC